VTQTPDKPGYNHRQFLKTGDPVVYNALAGEEARQADGVELIPSENYTYPEVLAVLGSVFTNKNPRDTLGDTTTAGRSTPISSRSWPAIARAACFGPSMSMCNLSRARR